MIGSLDLASRKVTVIGGGISGLLAAYYADQAGFEVTLHEKSKRLGGLIDTRQTTYGIAETAAHSLMVNAATRRLCGQLGVSLSPVQEDSRARFIYRDRKMKKFPLRAKELLKAVYLAGKKPAIEKHTSLEEWGNRHLGKAVTQYLLSPMVTGIFACSPAELSTAAVFPQLAVEPGESLLQHIKKTRGQKKGKKDRARMMAPPGGMATLVKALSGYLTLRLGDRIHLGSQLTSLPESSNTILCVEAPTAAHLLRDADPKLSKALGEIEYAPLVSVTVFVKKEQFDREPRGVGVLIPKTENFRILGVLFNSSSFPHRTTDDSLVSLTVMMGGTQDPAAVKLSDLEITDILNFELRRLLGLKGEIARMEVSRWPSAIPVYSDQVEIVWDLARRGWCSRPGHILFGNYAGKVSIRGMIEEAESRFAATRGLGDHYPRPHQSPSSGSDGK